MPRKFDFELIDNLLEYLRQKYEEEYTSTPKEYKAKAKRKLLDRHIWLKQFIKVENYLKANPAIDPNDIKDSDFDESFNPKSWMSSQRSLETRGMLLMERRHLLSLMGIRLKQTTYDDYICFMNTPLDVIDSYKQETPKKEDYIKKILKYKG